jgi:hypothetical protein
LRKPPALQEKPLDDSTPGNARFTARCAFFGGRPSQE